MNCPNCGTYNNEGSPSCINCGANLNVVPQNNQQEINNDVNNSKKNNKFNISSKYIIIGVATILVVFVIVFFITKKKNNSKLSEFDVNYANAFFLSDGSNYALFNNDGKQLTEFEFSYVYDFINETALVKKDAKYGVINSNGKMVVDFDKYDTIKSVAGLYKVTDKDDHEYLINGKGKVLYDMSNMELESYYDVDLYSILVDNNSKKYKVLNYNGKVLVEFNIDSNIEDIPSTNEEDNYMTVFYNKKNYVFDVSTSKKIVSFESDVHYCVNNVEEEGKIVTLNSCGDSSSDKTTYKFIKDGKLYDLNDKCERVYYSNKNLVCENGNKKNLIYSKGKVGIDLNDTSYIDNSNYAKEDGEPTSVDFYNKGKNVKKIECRKLIYEGYSQSGLYLLGTYYSSKCNTTSGIYEYYKSNGTKAFDKTFTSATSFNEDGVAVVSEDSDNYYLINKSGKKISNDYDKIYISKDYYIVKKDDLRGIIDKKGKEIINVNYSSIEIKERRNKKYAILKDNDSKYSVIDLQNNKVLVTSDNSLEIYSHYIFEYKDGNRKYYTLKGKLFYER